MAYKSSTMNAVQELTEKIIGFLSGLFRFERGLDDFAKQSSARIDEIILEEAQKGNSFGAGRFFIRLEGENAFRTAVEMYFTSPTGELLNVNAKSDPISLTALRQTDRDELMQKKEIAYNVDSPLKGGNVHPKIKGNGLASESDNEEAK